MPLEVIDVRADDAAPESLTRRHGGWDRPELAEATASVRRILAEVHADGDAAVLGYTERLDGVSLGPGRLRVTTRERDAAASRAGGALVSALEDAAASIRAYHERQLPQAWSMDRDGRSVGQVFRPVRRVGIYAPGGLGAYPSTVLMTAVPAVAAGVPEIVLCTPPGEAGEPADAIMAAARVAGVEEIYRVGGAQAIAAMAYGTQTIRACDKVVGPGNVYVTLAKRELYGVVGIDGLFGPSESLVVADDAADPSDAAWELVTQAEHALDAAAILVTTSEQVLAACLQLVEERLQTLPRGDVIREALATHGLAVLVRDLDQAVQVSNLLAPEHLCVQTADPDGFLEQVQCAGTVLLGGLTAASLSDYCAGPSHVLPTARTARFSSGLSVHDFLVALNVVRYTREGIEAQASIVDALSRAEDLEAHRRAMRSRLGEDDPT